MSHKPVVDPTQRETSVEQNIKAIWQEALKVHEVPNDVSFLDLDGDSLSAMLCIARMRTLFNVELTVEDFLLETSTISDFTRMIKEKLLQV